eukprot:GHVQ01037566.1.p1 GENE.GHVQ01037566.1~~GHVQ01037566.1.p1  ORF type:complete len:570 (-),score=147.06 GHVQ01037566.1:375-2084(-)
MDSNRTRRMRGSMIRCSGSDVIVEGEHVTLAFHDNGDVITTVGDRGTSVAETLAADTTEAGTLPAVTTEAGSTEADATAADTTAADTTAAGATAATATTATAATATVATESVATAASVIGDDSSGICGHSSVDDKRVEAYVCWHIGCYAVYKSKSGLQKHLKTHLSKTHYSCTECRAEYIFFSDLVAHRRSAHPANNLRRHRCHVCHQAYTRSKALRAHIALNHPPIAEDGFGGVLETRGSGMHQVGVEDATHRSPGLFLSPVTAAGWSSDAAAAAVGGTAAGGAAIAAAGTASDTAASAAPLAATPAGTAPTTLAGAAPTTTVSIGVTTAAATATPAATTAATTAAATATAVAATTGACTADGVVDDVTTSAVTESAVYDMVANQPTHVMPVPTAAAPSALVDAAIECIDPPLGYCTSSPSCGPPSLQLTAPAITTADPWETSAACGPGSASGGHVSGCSLTVASDAAAGAGWSRGFNSGVGCGSGESTSMLFVCKKPGCGKTFSKKSNLTQHHRVAHKGDRPFACKLCSSKFGWKVVLQRHMHSVHKDRNVVATSTTTTAHTTSTAS